MHCPYCRSVNDASDQRCARCGRRLHAGSSNHAKPSELAPVQQSAAAPALHVVPPPAVESAKAVSASAAQPATYQPSLFRDASVGPKVIPIPTLTPLHPVSREHGSRRAGLPAATAPRPRRRTPEGQGQLDLVEEAIAPSDEKILCDVPVAPPLQRAAAAFCDAGIVLSGTVVLLGMFFFFADGVVWTRTNQLLMGGVIACVAILYRALLSLGDGNTPGMRFAGLRLVDFDGRRPHRNKRIVRQAAGLLSLAAAGVGLLWALVDEEKLTWHDHISKTFPTHS